MSIKINNKLYSCFLDYDLTSLKDESVDTWISWFKERITMLTIRPMDTFFNRSSALNQKVNSYNSFFLMPAFINLLCVIRLLEGLSNPRHDLTDINCATVNSKLGYYWINTYMPRYGDSTEWNDFVLIWLEENFNSLTTKYAFSSGGIEFDVPNGLKTNDKEELHIDPEIFYDDFKEGFHNYIRDLKDIGRKELRDTFSKNFKIYYLS